LLLKNGINIAMRFNLGITCERLAAECEKKKNQINACVNQL
jgi:hypothetical protein